MILVDRFDNVLDVFPTEETGKWAVQLSENDYKTPIVYSQDNVIGNGLGFSVTAATPNEALKRYTAGIFEKTPYILTATYNSASSIKYPISLLGQGKGDLDAEIETAIDISKTYFSTTKLSMVAGEPVTLSVELRTNSNKRKADANPTFAFEFKQGDGKTDGKFYGKAANGELRGKYIISIDGQKANQKVGPTEVTIKVTEGGKQYTLPKVVEVTVSPNTLDHVTIPTDLKISASADDDYVFEVIPFDLYDNLAEVDEKDVNLKITFPTKANNAPTAATYKAVKDPKSGKIRYTIKSRTAGDYRIESPLLAASK